MKLQQTIAKLEKEGYPVKEKRDYDNAPESLQILEDQIKENSFPDLEIDPISEEDEGVFVIHVFESHTTKPVIDIYLNNDGTFLIETPKETRSYVEWSEQVIEILHKISESKSIRELLKNFTRFHS